MIVASKASDLTMNRNEISLPTIKKEKDFTQLLQRRTSNYQASETTLRSSSSGGAGKLRSMKLSFNLKESLLAVEDEEGMR